MNRILQNLLLCLFCLGSLSLQAQYTVTSGVGTVPFIDISGTGTIAGTFGDDGEASSFIPFDFTFYGVEYTAPVNIQIGGNGGILIGTNTGDVPFTNTALPASIGPAIFPLWDDLFQEPTINSQVFVETQGAAPDRVFIIQWNVYNYIGGFEPITFQVQLTEGTNIIAFSLQDLTADDAGGQNNAASATIGIDGGGATADQFSFNTFQPDGMGVSFDDPDDDVIVIPPGVEEVNLAAISDVNVTLNDACQAMVVVEMILSGDYDVDGNGLVPAPEAYNIVVQDDDPSNGPIIDGCGVWQWTVTADPEQIFGFTTAWGTINAEDKTSPEPVNVPEGPDDLFCDAVETVNISLLPSEISRCWIADGDSGATLNNSMNPALRARLLAGGGIPTFFDGCSNLEICVNDIVTNTGACDDIIITRTFTARDGLSCTSVSGEENAPAVVSYDITFIRPSIDDVEGVAQEAIFECDETFPLLPVPNQYGDINPEPQPSDYPFFAGPNGPIFLDDNFCNIGSTFEDGPRIQTCEQTYKFVRTFTVIDWCQPDEVETFQQLVKVGDFDAPTITPPSQDLDFNGEPDAYPLIFSTSNPDCSANFIVPAGGVTDNCDDNPTVVAYILPGGSTAVAALGPFAVNGAAFEIPAGQHVLRYIAADACDNRDTLDVPISIEDRTAPVAICEDGLDISLGGAGVAFLVPADIDRASYDECSGITREIAFIGEDNLPLPGTGGWQESLILNCDHLGTVAIGLRVTDAEGNSNTCWLNVLVEDKLAPQCVAPGPEVTTCDDEDLATLAQELEAAFAADPVGVGAQLDAIFGAANGLDNCPGITVTQSVIDTRNSCGVGAIIRSFSVEDAQGFVSTGTCSQFIQVLGIHDYTVVFPADAGSEECIEPDYNAVTFDERGCDLITTTTEIDTFQATADECYKLRITYEVLNWCEYSTEEDPYTIPRDADDDNFLEERTWLHVLPRAINTLDDDIAYLDRDNNRFNGFISPLDLHDPNGRVFGSSTEPYGTDESRGAFLYRQFIKVYDDVAPELTVTIPDTFEDEDGDCVEDVELGFTIADACTSADDFGALVQLDAFFGDTDGNDVLNLADFITTSNLVNGEVTNNGDGTFTVNLDNLPLGRHAIRIRAEDGCGNSDIDLIIFEIVDAKAPTPICINGLTVTLMPDGLGGGTAAIWASEYIVSGAEDCSGPVEYAIYRAADAAAADFEGPNPADTGIILTCNDDATLIVRVYAMDQAGNSDYCETTLLVQFNNDNICSGNGTGSIQGTILTEGAELVPGVDVNVSGEVSDQVVTDNQGVYVVSDLELGGDYTISPASEDYSFHLFDISTLDLVFITQHILGINALDSPYEYLAADADGNRMVSVTDLVAIRRLILGLDQEYAFNSAWRFVDADFVFPNPTNPWATTFPEVYNVNNLSGDLSGADFIAIMVGNVSGDISLTRPGMEEGGRSSLGLSVAERELVAGNTYTIEFTAAEAAELIGFQGTLQLGESLEFVDLNYGLLGTANFNLNRLERGQLAMSFNQFAESLDTDEVLFSLVVRATEDVNLSEQLMVTSDAIRAEAYNSVGEVFGLGLNFGQDELQLEVFNLYQNAPNPVADRTQIAFNLVEDAEVTLTVQDVAGRVVLVRQFDGSAGYNNLNLSTTELKASGVLTYTLVAGEYVASKKMVVVR
ncbi:MAG: T9SS type A sorting domain-containing protein [Bacteroidota bacterium]